MKHLTKIVLLSSIIPFAYLACSNGTSQNAANEIGEEKGNTTISGQLQNGGSAVLVVELLKAQGADFVDSVQLDENGNFSTSVNIEHPTFYRLKISNTSFTNIAVDKGDNLVVNGDANSLSTNHTVQGSYEAETYKLFGDKMAELYKKRDSLNKAMQQHQANQDGQAMMNAQNYFGVLQNEFLEFSHSFIDEHAGSMASLAAVSGLQPETDLAYYQKVDKSMAEKMPNSSYYQQLHQTVLKASTLAIGTVAPEIVSTRPDGTTQSLADLKGNVVLVDFWASWCGPCRRESPNVVKAYNKFKDKGFTVFSVSLDGMPKQKDPKQDWLKAIAQDGLLWDNHVSDLKGWGSAVVPVYQIQGIPLTVLVDKEGKIIAKNLRGPQLEQKLAEILG